MLSHVFFCMLGNDDLADSLKIRYKETRFIKKKDVWPPEQLHFTPPLIVHYLENPNVAFYESLAKAKAAGGARVFEEPKEFSCSEYKIDNEDVQRMKNTKTTKDLRDVTSQLEISDSARPRIALIEGAPGIGKTEIMKEIAYQWAQGKLLTSSDLVLLIRLRDPVAQNLTSLNELFKYFCQRENIHTDNYITHLTKDGGKHITILLDGYDELPERLREDSFIARLIDKEELPAATVVVSSRPHASRKIRQNVSCYVDILGFTKDEQQAFIEESLKGQSEKIKELSNYLDCHPNISSLCYIPFNMVILLWLFKEGIKPKVSTELYNLFVLHTIQNSLTKFNLPGANDFSKLSNLPTPYKEVMQQLCTLCLKAVDNKQLVFTLDDIKLFCPNLESIPGVLNGFGLLQATEHTTVMGRPTKIFNFVHSSI